MTPDWRSVLALAEAAFLKGDRDARGMLADLYEEAGGDEAAAALRKAPTVWVLVTDVDGNIDTSVHSTPQGAHKHLARWCRSRWEEEEHGGEYEDETALPADDEEAVRKYFSWWKFEVSFRITEAKVDAEERAKGDRAGGEGP